jgi:hypothetical protein
VVTKEQLREREKEKREMSGNEVIGQSQAGPIEKIPNLKKRQRAIYYREVNGEWQPTQPLPSDAVGRELYFSKGFRLSIPKPTDTATPDVTAIDTEKESLLAEVTRLKKELGLVKARATKKEKSES